MSNQLPRGNAFAAAAGITLDGARAATSAYVDAATTRPQYVSRAGFPMNAQRSVYERPGADMRYRTPGPASSYAAASQYAPANTATGPTGVVISGGGTYFTGLVGRR